MNLTSSNKIFLPIFRRNLRFLSTLQNVNKNKNLCYTNRNGPASFSLSRNSCRTFLGASSTLHSFNSQQRSISSQSEIKPDLSTVGEQLGLHATPGFIYYSDWKIVEIAQNVLLNVHSVTGLPWWATVIVTAITARICVTLPFSIYQTYNTAKLQSLNKEMESIAKTLKREASYAVQIHKWPESLAKMEYNKKIRKEWKELVIRENCHPGKSFILILIQVPLWFSFSVATRNLCYMLPKADTSAKLTFIQMQEGGFGWISNLTVPDPYFILPITFALVNFSIYEAHQMFRTTPLTKIEKIVSYCFKGIIVLLLPIAASMPAATITYWLTSSVFGLCQVFLLHSTRLRRLCGIPQTSKEMQHPYRHFFEKLKARIGRT